MQDGDSYEVQGRVTHRPKVSVTLKDELKNINQSYKGMQKSLHDNILEEYRMQLDSYFKVSTK